MLNDLLDYFRIPEITLDMYNNSDEDDCKSKYNNLLHILSIFPSGHRGIVNYLSEPRYMTQTLKKNKDALLLYLYIANDVISNQSINEQVLLNENLDNIKDLKGNLDLSTIEGKTLLLNQIRNAFAHKSGKIYLYNENGVNKVRIDNKNWFSIETNLTDLNSLFERLIAIDQNNKGQVLINNLIDHVKKDEYYKMTEDEVIILRLNHLMCFNKESLFDKFMVTQSSFIDASKFYIKSTSNWDCNEAKMRNRFFDKYNIIFQTKEDEESYNNEWKDTVDITDSSNSSSINYIYDTKKMPFDEDTGRHIPIPLFMNYLRNANSHGRIIVKGDSVVFYDQDNSDNSEPFFYMEIKKEDLLDFIFSDYFLESVSISVDEHKDKYKSELYLLEQSESVNNFDNYINIYKNRMPNLTEYEIIRYMYDNNKFSAYLLEYPEQIDSFMKYKLSDGKSLINLLCTYGNSNINIINSINPNNKNIKNEIKWYKNNGGKSYLIFVEELFQALKDKEIDKVRNKDYDFFTSYYLFLNNLRSIKPNITLEDLNKIDSETRVQINESIKELQNEFIDNLVVVDNSSLSERFFVEAGIQNKHHKELELIILAIGLGKGNNKVKTNNRHTINSIKKHNTLSQVYTESANSTLDDLKSKRNKILVILAVNVAVKVLDNLFFSWADKYGIPIPAIIELLSFPVSMVFVNLIIYYNMSLFKDYQKEISNYSDRVFKYSEDDGGPKDEDRNNGSNNIRK